MNKFSRTSPERLSHLCVQDNETLVFLYNIIIKQWLMMRDKTPCIKHFEIFHIPSVENGYRRRRFEKQNNTKKIDNLGAPTSPS